MRHKTLVYHNGALGDLLLSLPAIKIIKERSGWVHLVGRPNAAMLLRQMGEVVDTSSSDSSLFTSLYAGEPDERIREFLMGFDDVVMFSSRNDTAVAQAIRLTVKRLKQS